MTNNLVNNPNSYENDVSKKKSFFSKGFIFKARSQDQLGKKIVSSQKKKKQITIIVITVLIFIACICVAGYLIWLVQNKENSNDVINTITNSSFYVNCVQLLKDLVNKN